MWHYEELALVIAKLKKEGFEIYFIQNSENNDIFKSKIDDSKFKDKKGNSQNIFGLSDDFIKDNFSQQTHEKSAEKLKLASDDSIILDYEQLKEIHSIITQEHWVDEKKINVKSPLAWGVLEGLTEKVNSQSYEQVIDSAKNVEAKGSLGPFFNLLRHKDFNIEDRGAKEAFCSLLDRLRGNNNYPNTFYALDEKKLGDLFDAIPSFTNLSEEEEITLQKDILKQLWFKHPNFKEGVLKRAQTLNEFKEMPPHEIGISLHGDLENFSHKVADNLSKNYSLDISERYPEERNLEIFKSLIDKGALNGADKAFSILAKHQKENTTFGQKIKVNFTPEDNDENNYFIKYRLSGPEAGVEGSSLTLESFLELFSDSEINQHFGLTEKFGDALSDLPKKVQEILKDYVKNYKGDNSKPFPFAISYNEYKLPDFQYKEQFLSALFDIENKGSCRHRVAALAHRFTQEGLQYGADFKILEINQNHAALEVKKEIKNGSLLIWEEQRQNSLKKKTT